MPWYRRLSSPPCDGGIEDELGSFPAVIRVRDHCCLGNSGEAHGGKPKYLGNKGEVK